MRVGAGLRTASGVAVRAIAVRRPAPTFTMGGFTVRLRSSAPYSDFLLPSCVTRESVCLILHQSQPFLVVNL